MTIYQKVIAAYGILRSAINGRMSKYDVAHEFRGSATYAVGRLVIHDDKLYRCTTAHTGPWDANDFVQSTVDEAIIYEIDRAVLAASAEFAEKTDIASEFSRTQRYDVNRLVVYENVLYRCSVAHPAGEWNEDHFVRATVDDVIALNGGLKNIADNFDKTKSYSAGQLVVYDNILYRCTSTHSGDWTAADFVESTVSGALNLMATKTELADLGSSTDLAISGKIGLDKIAGEFSTGTAYSVGQIVKKDGKLYRCTTAHAAGSWNSGADFTEAPVSVSVNQMAEDIASLNGTIAQTALKSDLGYSGKSYDIDVSDDVGTIYVHDMEVAVLHLSYSGGSPSSIHVDLPDVESEDGNGNFHATRCFIIVDASEIDDSEHMPSISVGSADDTVLWTSMSGFFQEKSLNLLSLTYAGRNVWHCDQQYAAA